MTIFYVGLWRLSQDNQIKQRRAWLLLGWATAERSCPCKQPACPAIGGGSEVTFKPLVPRLSVREGFLALTSPESHAVLHPNALKKQACGVAESRIPTQLGLLRRTFSDPISSKKFILCRKRSVLHKAVAFRSVKSAGCGKPARKSASAPRQEMNTTSVATYGTYAVPVLNHIGCTFMHD
ncbi:hypothetical protein J6590_011149 [Homalodisca vitripennis]|nr:hypothetical protein J6590_011149 [Homalodisca vitripennis]